MRGVAILAAFTSLSVTPSSIRGLEEVEQRWIGHLAIWDWAQDHPPSRVAVSLARGDVRIVRWDRDRIEIRARAPDPEDDGSAATIVVTRDEGGLRIFDRYPALPLGGMRECYPPDDEHGGAWIYGDRIKMTVMMPRSSKVSASTVDGSVTETVGKS